MTGFITIEPRSSADIGRWGITFLVGSSLLHDEEREHLMRDASEMYLYKEKKRNVENDSFEGRLLTEGKYRVIGFFSGQEYNAVLDLDERGRVKVSFLVSEQTGREKGVCYN